MKNLTYLWAFILILLCSACNKDDVVAPDFEVIVDKKEVKINDSITFSFSGSPDVITFYSGEKNREYKYKERTTLPGGKKELTISTQVTYGSQSNNLRLLASANFDGNYTPEALKAAKWTDITDKFTLSVSPSGVLGPITVSNKVDVSDLFVSGKPLFFAFKYQGQATTSGATTTQRGWRIYEFNLNNTFPDGTVSAIATRATGGWQPINVEDAVKTNGTSKWVYISNMFYYDPSSSLLASEGWYVTKALLADGISPDKGVPIKEYSQRRESYKYAFNTPGTYKVTFVGSNVNYTGQKEVVKEIEIKVLP